LRIPSCGEPDAETNQFQADAPAGSAHRRLRRLSPTLPGSPLRLMLLNRLPCKVNGEALGKQFREELKQTRQRFEPRPAPAQPRTASGRARTSAELRSSAYSRLKHSAEARQNRLTKAACSAGKDQEACQSRRACEGLGRAFLVCCSGSWCNSKLSEMMPTLRPNRMLSPTCPPFRSRLRPRPGSALNSPKADSAAICNTSDDVSHCSKQRHLGPSTTETLQQLRHRRPIPQSPRVADGSLDGSAAAILATGVTAVLLGITVAVAAAALLVLLVRRRQQSRRHQRHDRSRRPSWRPLPAAADAESPTLSQLASEQPGGAALLTAASTDSSQAGCGLLNQIGLPVLSQLGARYRLQRQPGVHRVSAPCCPGLTAVHSPGGSAGRPAARPSQCPDDSFNIDRRFRTNDLPPLPLRGSRIRFESRWPASASRMALLIQSTLFRVTCLRCRVRLPPLAGDGSGGWRGSCASRQRSGAAAVTATTAALNNRRCQARDRIFELGLRTPLHLGAGACRQKLGNLMQLSLARRRTQTCHLPNRGNQQQPGAATSARLEQPVQTMPACGNSGRFDESMPAGMLSVGEVDDHPLTRLSDQLVDAVGQGRVAGLAVLVPAADTIAGELIHPDSWSKLRNCATPQPTGILDKSDTNSAMRNSPTAGVSQPPPCTEYSTNVTLDTPQLTAGHIAAQTA
uniref:Protein kinase domain-containing protein n=1 Tax=Macrostomum lignano TaxID=282301 RepID=A0A1I8JNG8_9PLAT